MTCEGIIIVLSTRMKSAVRPGKRTRANPYATRLALSTVPTITHTTMINVLIVERTKGKSVNPVA